MVQAQKSKGPAKKAAPKAKKPVATGKKVDDDREETLQAVVWSLSPRSLLLPGGVADLFLHRSLRILSRPDLVLLHWKHQE
jgi:hypothetical protein